MIWKEGVSCHQKVERVSIPLCEIYMYLIGGYLVFVGQDHESSGGSQNMLPVNEGTCTLHVCICIRVYYHGHIHVPCLMGSCCYWQQQEYMTPMTHFMGALHSWCAGFRVHVHVNPIAYACTCAHVLYVNDHTHLTHTP